jgi:hypothetical protein
MCDDVTTSRPKHADEGAALAMVLVLMLIASFIVLPLSGYVVAVGKQRTATANKLSSTEATKAALRVALVEPVTLFSECGTQSTETVPLVLPAPMLAEAVVSKCYLIASSAGVPISSLPHGTTMTVAGSTPPSGAWFVGSTAPTSGNADAAAWRSNIAPTKTAQTIWSPAVPSVAVYTRSSTPYDMPALYKPCKVFFPGRYTSAVTITGSTPVYFTSGVYYFEQPVTISGNATVVVGAGSSKGCVDSDQVAAFYATDAPNRHGITGLGATFVFGGAGRLVVDASTVGTSTSLLFNKRYVSTAQQALDSTNEVSILSVNGEVLPGLADMVRANLQVPASVLSGTGTPVDPMLYKPSTLLPGGLTPILDIDLLDARTATIKIPGYVAVPQGTISITTAAAATTKKTVRIYGGILAGSLELSPDVPEVLEVGYRNPVTMRTFKIESVSSKTGVSSTAIVQIKENGVYAINSWWFDN